MIAIAPMIAGSVTTSPVDRVKDRIELKELRTCISRWKKVVL